MRVLICNELLVRAYVQWWKPLENESAAAVLYSQRANATIGFDLSELQYMGKPALPAGATSCAVKAVWDNVEGLPVETVGGRFSAEVPAGDVVFVILSGCKT